MSSPAAIEQVDRLALVGVIRDRNSLAANIAAATEPAVLKVVGHTAVVSTLAPA